MKKINIAILGYGKVAKELLELIKSSHTINVTAILVHNIKKYDENNPYYQLFTEQYDSILKSECIDVIVELIGGLEPACQYVKEALSHDISIVTANRPLMAYHYEELQELSKKHHVSIHYEGSVGCGIPIIEYLSMINCHSLKRITAMANSSSNVIITKIFDEEYTLKDAINFAIDHGYTEKNWIDDVSGIDTGEKILILLASIFDQQFELRAMNVCCTFDFTDADIEVIKNRGFVIKQIAYIEFSFPIISVNIDHYLIEQNTHLANIKMNKNYFGIEYNDETIQEFNGQGASPYQTAMAVYSDIKRYLVRGISDQSMNVTVSESNLVNLWIRIQQNTIDKTYLNILDTYSKDSYMGDNYKTYWLYDVPITIYGSIKRMLENEFEKDSYMICRIFKST